MLDENKNLKDSYATSALSVLRRHGNTGGMLMSYTKTNKLIIALYMVTDIMDKEEPLRNKLRTLGTEIISDTDSLHTHLDQKISAIISLLDIALTVNLISEMNSTILKREFLKMKEFLNSEVLDTQRNSVLLEDFFGEEEVENKFQNSPHPNPLLIKERVKEVSNGHQSINFGLQKGHTLMKAISDKIKAPSTLERAGGEAFNNLKKQRHEEIIKIIKDKGGATIKDIKDNAQGVLRTCGEKTLQRELISMVKDNLLKKTGEKRWSKYNI
ncbi:MAG: hypothetical protein V4439_03995 [Patescibacteria group bacterium]